MGDPQKLLQFTLLIDIVTTRNIGSASKPVNERRCQEMLRRFAMKDNRMVSTMKILVLNPVAGKLRTLSGQQRGSLGNRNCFENMPTSSPQYVTYIYYRHRCADAVVIESCVLRRAFRCRVYFLVLRPWTWGHANSSYPGTVHSNRERITSRISQRYSVISTEPKTSHCYWELAQLYGTAVKVGFGSAHNLSP